MNEQEGTPNSRCHLLQVQSTAATSTGTTSCVASTASLPSCRRRRPGLPRHPGAERLHRGQRARHLRLDGAPHELAPRALPRVDELEMGFVA